MGLEVTCQAPGVASVLVSAPRAHGLRARRGPGNAGDRTERREQRDDGEGAREVHRGTTRGDGRSGPSEHRDLLRDALSKTDADGTRRRRTARRRRRATRRCRSICPPRVGRFVHRASVDLSTARRSTRLHFTRNRTPEFSSEHRASTPHQTTVRSPRATTNENCGELARDYRRTSPRTIRDAVREELRAMGGDIKSSAATRGGCADYAPMTTTEAARYCGFKT